MSGGRAAPARRGRRMRTSTRTLLALHVLLAVYSVSAVFSKLAAGYAFLSWRFVLLYGGVLLVLGVYAIGWQQVIKRMPLTTAYANKAATVVWGIVFGAACFGEEVTPPMLLGAAVIVAGIVLFALEDGRVQAEQERAMNAQLAGAEPTAQAAPGSGEASGTGETPRAGKANANGEDEAQAANEANARASDKGGRP